jgi:hypothetical protein
VYAGLGRDRGQRHGAHPVSGGQGAASIKSVTRCSLCCGE